MTASSETAKTRIGRAASVVLIEDDDTADREEAAAKLAQYPVERRLWGLPTLIDGGRGKGKREAL